MVQPVTTLASPTPIKSAHCSASRSASVRTERCGSTLRTPGLNRSVATAASARQVSVQTMRKTSCMHCPNNASCFCQRWTARATSSGTSVVHRATELVRSRTQFAPRYARPAASVRSGRSSSTCTTTGRSLAAAKCTNATEVRSSCEQQNLAIQ